MDLGIIFAYHHHALFISFLIFMRLDFRWPSFNCMMYIGEEGEEKECWKGEEKRASLAVLIIVHSTQVIICKCLSYEEERENLWMISASKPLQRCARLIMGYITHGTFSHTHARGAGIGWVGLKPLLILIQRHMTYSSQKSSFWEVPFRQKTSKCLPVLVRNPTSLQYRWAELYVVKGPCLHVSNGFMPEADLSSCN